MNLHKFIIMIALIIGLSVYLFSNTSLTINARVNDYHFNLGSQAEPVEVIFDVKSIIGKSPDEVETLLGAPTCVSSGERTGFVGRIEVENCYYDLKGLKDHIMISWQAGTMYDIQLPNPGVSLIKSFPSYGIKHGVEFNNVPFYERSSSNEFVEFKHPNLVKIYGVAYEGHVDKLRIVVKDDIQRW